MERLQKKNQEQFQDLSSQLQVGLQAFLQQSVNDMLSKLQPPQPQAPAATAPTALATASAAPTIATTPVATDIPPTDEPMDVLPSTTPATQIKKGLVGIKGKSTVAKQSLHAVASQVTVPTTTATVTSSLQPPRASSVSRLSSPLQVLEQEDYGTDTSSAFSASSKPEETPEVGEQAPPPNLPFRELVQKVREFLAIPDPATEGTTS